MTNRLTSIVQTGGNLFSPGKSYRALRTYWRTRAERRARDAVMRELTTAQLRDIGFAREDFLDGRCNYSAAASGHPRVSPIEMTL